MVFLSSLWLPIVVSAGIVFAASAILHMVLTYHRSDYRQLPDEGAIAAAVRAASPPPGTYTYPWCSSQKEMGSPATVAKYQEGPVMLVTVLRTGMPSMGKYLAQWFLFCLLVSVFVAYLADRTLGGGADYLTVFRVTGTAAFMAYGLGEVVNSIWRGQPWATTIKSLFDGLVYSLLTAGTFGWLWPAA